MIPNLTLKGGRPFALLRLAVLALVLATVALLLPALPAFAQPVLPGAAGYGTDTPAGRGGKVYHVTSLADTNTPGTLRYAINQTEPRTIIFDVSGTIEVNNYLDISNPYVTIAGQTAPSPGIFLRGATIRIMTHDVLLQHLRAAPGDQPGPVPPTNRDALAITSPAGGLASNIVIDHCTFTWSVDEMFETWGPTGDITFKQVLAAEPLNDSIHIDEGATEPEPHGFGPVFDNQADSRVTMVGGLFSHAEGRLPYAMSGEYVQVNNVFYDRINTFNRLAAQRGVPTKNTLIGNVFKNGPSLADWASERGVVEISNTFVAGGQAYLEDNKLLGFQESSQWDLTTNKSAVPLAEVQAAEPPVWNEGLTVRPSGEVVDWVLAQAGARPADRLPYETRIVENARNGTGEVVDSLAQIGGWPVVAEHARRLVIPKNPGADADGDGYTNLEEWLESYSAYVEGRGAEPPLIAPEDGEPEQEPEPVPVPSKNVSGLTVAPEASGAASWAVMTNLQPGDLTYTDRAFRFETIPGGIVGSDWIMVANNSKTYTGSALSSFRVTVDSDVYLAFDDRMTAKPAWLLADWTDTGEDITVSSPSIITYSLFHRSYPAGSTVNLGPNGNTVNVLYLPIVKAVPAVGNGRATITAPAEGAVLTELPDAVTGTAVDPDSNNAAVGDIRVSLLQHESGKYLNPATSRFDAAAPAYGSALFTYNPVDDAWSYPVAGIPFANGTYTVTASVYDGAAGAPASATFTVAVVSKAALSAAIAEAEALLDAAVEGTAPGQYEPGAKAALQASIAAARAVADDPDATQAEVDDAVLQLQAAVETFRARLVERRPEDVNGDGEVSVEDLLQVVFHFGKTSESPNWETAQSADVNGDLVVDHKDLALVAHRIAREH